MDERLRRAERDGGPERVRAEARRAGLDPWRALRDALAEVLVRRVHEADACPCGPHRLLDLLATRGRPDLEVRCYAHGFPDPEAPHGRTIGRVLVEDRRAGNLVDPQELLAQLEAVDRERGPAHEGLAPLVVDRLRALALLESFVHRTSEGGHAAPFVLRLRWDELLGQAIAESLAPIPRGSRRERRAWRRRLEEPPADLADAVARAALVVHQPEGD